MRRELLRTSAFIRAAKRVAKKNPAAADDLRAALKQLAEDAFHPSLRTHKLKGQFAGIHACSAGYDLRVLFKYVEHEASEAVLLLTVGTHDEVY